MSNLQRKETLLYLVSFTLANIKKCILSSRYTLADNENRQENKDFISNFNLTKNEIENLLLDIRVEEFVEMVDNYKSEFKDERLYVFCPIRVLTDFTGADFSVNIYIKFNIKTELGGDWVIVVSFHESNKPVTYPLK